MEEAVKKEMSNKSINLIGWILFIISAMALLYLVLEAFGQCLGVYFSYCVPCVFNSFFSEGKKD